MKLPFIFLLMVLLTAAASAQNTDGGISGVVKDIQGNAVAGATIHLKSLADTLQQRTTAADGYGAFSFKNMASSRYVLTCTGVGYLRFTSPAITLDAAHRTVDLPAIVLLSSGSQTLKAVTIVSKKPLIEQRIDRTIVNVDAMISAAGSNTLEVLAKAPGVYVDPNGDIQLNGKGGVLVLINDKQTYLSVPDLAAYLRSLPAALVDKIELMSNPSSKYDAAGSAVINLLLKKNDSPGFNGNVSLSYVRGVDARSNNAFMFNYRAMQVNVFGSLSYNKDANFTNSSGSRTFDDNIGALQSTLLLNSRYTYQSDSWNGRAGLDYTVSPNTTLGILLTGNTRPKTDQLNYTTRQYNAAGQPDTLSNGSTNGNYQWKSGGVNLNLLHKFDQNGQKLTADIDYIRYQSDGAQLSPTASYNGNDSLTSSSTYLYQLPSDINIYSIKTDYTLPLAGKARIDAGLKSSLVNTDNQNDWFDQSGNTFIPDYPKTNHFIYRENVNSIYLSATREWKRWGIQAGLRAEHTLADGQQTGNAAVPDSSFAKNYTHVFPSLYLSHKLDSAGNNTIILSYGVRVRRPNYQQLDPFLFYINPYTYTAGNPNLNPQYNHIYELKYAYKQYFGFAFDYFRIDGIVYNITQLTGNTFITRPENFGTNSSVNLNAYVSVSPLKGWDINANFLLYNLTNKGNAYGVLINDNHTTGEFEVSNQFQFSRGWSAEFNYFYHGKGYGGQTTAGPISNTSAGIQKKILNGNGTIRLKADDIFRTLVNRSVTTGLGQATAINTSEWDTRLLGLSFSYRFGKAANARKSNHNAGGAGDEQGRTN
jgi:hypothetical protein